MKQAASPIVPGREWARPPVGKGCGQGEQPAGFWPAPGPSLPGRIGTRVLLLVEHYSLPFFSFCLLANFLRLTLLPASRGNRLRTFRLSGHPVRPPLLPEGALGAESQTLSLPVVLSKGGTSSYFCSLHLV